MFEKLFCRHEWNVLAEIVQPRLKSINGPIECSETLLETMLYGKTKVIFTCDKCGKRDEKEYIGEIT